MFILSSKWRKSYGGVYADELKSISQTNDNGFIVGGNSNSILSGNKTDENIGLSDYYLIPIFLHSLLGAFLHRYLLSFLPCQVHSLASGKTCNR